MWSHFVKRCRKATFVQKTKAGLCQEAARWVGLELTAGCSTVAWRAEAWPLLFSLYWIKNKSSGLFSHACYLILFIYNKSCERSFKPWKKKRALLLCAERNRCEFSRARQLSLFVLSCLISTPCKVFWGIWTVRKNVQLSRCSSTRFFTHHLHISQHACAHIFISSALVRFLFFFFSLQKHFSVIALAPDSAALKKLSCIL